MLSQLTLQVLKDLLYLVGSILGIIGFVRTLKQRDLCELNYRTNFGNEVMPLLVCIRGDIFNLEITDKTQSFFAFKYPTNTIPSQIKEINVNIIDKSAFFPIIKEGEIICFSNENLNMPKVYFYYEDKFHNKYYQSFSFDKAALKNKDKIKQKSRRYYKISNRYWKFAKIWFPINIYYSLSKILRNNTTPASNPE